MQGTEPITVYQKSRSGARVSRERLLEVLTGVGKVIAVSGSLQAVMDVVAEECARLTRADGATIFLAENQRLTAKSAVGILGFTKLEVSLNSGVPSHAVKIKRAVRSTEADMEDGSLRRASSKSGARASVTAPFFFGVDQEIGGVLHVVSQSPDAFGAEDEDTIQMFADIVGSAIQNARQFDQAMRESREDALTSLLNRRAFEEHIRMLKKEQLNHRQPYCLILFDVDRLKMINDLHGHPTGDEVIRRVAVAARMHARKSDIVYRLGGDEFAVLLPQTTLGVAQEVARRLEAAVRAERSEGHAVSVSTGTCQADPNESVPLLLTRTDQLMYRAKYRHHLEDEDYEKPDHAADKTKPELVNWRPPT